MNEKKPTRLDSTNMFFIYDERGGRMQVIATDKNDAIEKYWEGMESIFGHSEKSCECFKKPLPFPREKYLQPVKVINSKDLK